jgi:hypothetical protein
MANAAPEGLTRRAMLAAGGSLVVAFSLRPDHVIAQEPGTQGPKNDGPKLPGSLDKTPMLDAWIRIDADGKVTVFSGKAELGQGIKTALIQVAGSSMSPTASPCSKRSRNGWTGASEVAGQPDQRGADQRHRNQ